MLSADRNSIHSNQFSLCILRDLKDFDITSNFDCGDDELNEFFQKDALDYKKELLAETYYFQPKLATEENLIFPVAFISFLNDTILITKQERKKEKKKFYEHLRNNMPHEKRSYPSYPAVKIGRLGVTKKYQCQDIGTSLINMTKEMFLTNNRTECHFLTVDAINRESVINFYNKNGFDFLWEEDKDEKTRIMFFDLKRHKGTG